MFVIVVYDMKSERTHKPRKLLRQYLTHMQNSVFQGSITQGDLNSIKPKLKEMPTENESIVIYEMSTDKYINRTAIGNDPCENDQFI